MKVILSLAVLAAAACAVGAWYWGGEEPPPQLMTSPVEQNDILIGVSATGTVEPVEVIDVGAQIIGRIRSFGPDPDREGKTIDYSSQVSKGDVLAKLDDSPLQNELARARADVKLVEAELQRHRAQLKQAKQNLDRAEKLRKTKSNSAAELDEAIANHEVAQADVAVGDARLEQAKLAEKTAQINLTYATIASPIDGVVIDRRVDVGQTVVAGMNAPSLFLMARDLSKMQVLAAVNEADIGDIQDGQRVTFRVDAYRDSKFAGVVSQIRLNAGMSHNVVTYDVVVDIDNTDGKLLPYMTANLQFEVARRANVLQVPNQALRWRPPLALLTPAERANYEADSSGLVKTDSDTLVWVECEDGFLRPVEVTPGLSDGVTTEIASEELEKDMTVAVGVKRRRKQDFVSSFLSKVTK